MSGLALKGDETFIAAVLTTMRLSGQEDGPFQFTGSLQVALTRADCEHVEVDGVDGPIESALVRHITELSTSGAVLLRRRAGVQSDQKIALTLHARDLAAVSRAIARTCYDTRTVAPPAVALPAPEPPAQEPPAASRAWWPLW